MLALALLLAVAQPQPVKVLVLDVKSESVASETTRALRDEIAVELARSPALSVLSTEDLRASVSIEAESRALGCDTTSCLAEVGAALGARYIVHGSIAKIGGTYAIYLNLFDTEKNEAIAREVVNARSDAELLTTVRGGAATIRERMAGRISQSSAGSAGGAADEIDPLFVGGAIGAGVGAVVTVIGAVVALDALGTVNNLDEDVDARKEAQGTGLAASIVTGIGVVVLAGGAALATMQVLE